ncbi:SCO1664 family protein [Actinacidiphila acidipaludis]|uniref:SCO1664 family protein n=1 Tax=Actinacidiphila acidipaludis TaxID=2873382 RepID=A0ABS7QBG6_9ACTN|nr:SCO1664 family protein [Streptomyces acidipaludis]MBY8880476.1 SCO1664 family protein [Streptomyces acidipaludis]
MPASERVPEVGLIPAAPGTTEAAAHASGRSGARGAGPSAPDGTHVLLHGELTVRGQVREASNAVLYCEAVLDGRSVTCVYKPVAGERPLWDFPDGTLAQREVAAYLISEATGWGLIPPTVLRDGPYGEGMVQLWIDVAGDGEILAGPDDADGTDDGDTDDADGTDDGDTDDADGRDGHDDDGDGVSPEGQAGPGPLLALSEELEPAPGWKAVVEAETGDGRTVLLVHADDIRLRRLAVLDAVINNADRKGGHLLPAPDGRLYGIDHGVTFHTEDKLRTLLWGWAGEPLPAEAVPVLERLAAALDGALGERLAELLTAAETDALRQRVRRLRETGVHPAPGGQWPSIPWPPV